MGLGKTLQSISVLVYMKEYRSVHGPHLIVVPKSTLSNWMKEIKRWAPTLTAVQLHGTKIDRDHIIQEHLEPAQKDEDRKWNIVITTYEVCNIEKSVLTKFAWSYLIIGKSNFKSVEYARGHCSHILHCCLLNMLSMLVILQMKPIA